MCYHWSDSTWLDFSQLLTGQNANLHEDPDRPDHLPGGGPSDTIETEEAKTPGKEGTPPSFPTLTPCPHQQTLICAGPWKMAALFPTTTPSKSPPCTGSSVYGVAVNSSVLHSQCPVMATTPHSSHSSQFKSRNYQFQYSWTCSNPVNKGFIAQ